MCSNRILGVGVITLILPMALMLSSGCTSGSGQETDESSLLIVSNIAKELLDTSSISKTKPADNRTAICHQAENTRTASKLAAWLEVNDFANITTNILNGEKPSRTTIVYRADFRDGAIRLAEFLSVREMRLWHDGDPDVDICLIPGDDFDDINLFANPALPDGDMTVLHERSAPLDNPVTPADDPKPDGIYISLGRKALSLYAGGELKGTWQCAVGVPSRPTPKGKYTVVSMLKNPDWSWQGKVIPPGAKNGLGSRFLGISKPSYGIHGTNNPDSIGKALTHGCLRMHNRDVETLYEMVEVGTPVTIED